MLKISEAIELMQLYEDELLPLLLHQRFFIEDEVNKSPSPDQAKYEENRKVHQRLIQEMLTRKSVNDNDL